MKNIHLRCRSVDEESGVACMDLSRDNNTLLIAREGMLLIYKKEYGQFTLIADWQGKPRTKAILLCVLFTVFMTHCTNFTIFSCLFEFMEIVDGSKICARMHTQTHTHTHRNKHKHTHTHTHTHRRPFYVFSSAVVSMYLRITLLFKKEKWITVIIIHPISVARERHGH